MWGNLGNVVGSAIQKVQKMQNEIESQLDAAVGVEKVNQVSQPPNVTQISQTNDSSNIKKLNLSKYGENSHMEAPSAIDLSAPVDMKIDTTPKKTDQCDDFIESEYSPCGDINVRVVKPQKSRKKKNQGKKSIENQNANNSSRIVKLNDNDNFSELQNIDGKDDQVNYDFVSNQSSQEDFKSLLEDKEKEVNAIHAENSDLLKALQTAEKRNDDLLKKHAAEVWTYESHIKRIETDLKTKDSASSDSHAGSQNEINRLIHRVKELEEELNAKHQQLVVAERSSPQHTMPLAESDSTSSTSMIIINGLRQQINEKDDEICNQRAVSTRLEESLAKLQQHCSSLTNDMAIKTDTIKKLEEDINRKNEIINERERALETAASKYSETFKQLDEMQRRVSDLQTEVSEKDDRLRQLQSSLAMEGDVKKMLVLCQDEIREKDEKLKCFEIEGQNLSRKQGEMEKSLRNAKKEVREKEAEITRLVAAKDQLTKSLEEARNAIKKHEGDVNSASKTLSAMQAVSQSSADKIAKLESDLNAKVEELSSQRRALDASWTEISELKRTMAQLKAERDDLQKRIGEDTSKAIETETTQRDAEYRVATLTANIKQLQDSLQRQMSEAAGREERLREEASEMRKRWQEAITSRENLALDQSNATAPLLRQISTLQDQLRTKTEAWQRVESSLSERALRAENMIELAEQKRQMIEEQLRESKQQYTILTSKYEELLSSVHAVETTSNDREAARLKLAAEKSEIESKLNQEAFLNQSLQSSIRELESKYKSELHDFKDVSELQIRQLEFKVHELKSENELLMRDIEDERSKRERGLKLPKQTKERTDITEDKEDEHVTRATSKVFQTMMPGLLPNGEMSFVASERVLQHLQQKEEEVIALNATISQLQATRDALLEEVSYLSNKTAKLEEELINYPKIVEEMNTYRHRSELLLILLGEKEEELEGALADMKEIKEMYRHEMDELLMKITAPSNTTSTLNESPIRSATKPHSKLKL